MYCTLISPDFWDTAGQERFASLHPGYYHRAHACILVFDVTRKITYQHLEDWYKELQNYRPGLPTLVVANKIDVDYNVTTKKFAFPTKHPVRTVISHTLEREEKKNL
jgi:Rab-like protein 2